MRNFAKIILAFVCLASASIATQASAGVAVVVHPDSAIAKADADEVKKLFLGKSKTLGGQRVKPVDQTDSDLKEKFYSIVVGKNSAQLRAYWSKLVFTGKGTPPKEVGSDADVVKAVSSDPKLVGYVDASAADSSVVVVLTVD